jgi:hypothetical protein
MAVCLSHVRLYLQFFFHLKNERNFFPSVSFLFFCRLMCVLNVMELTSQSLVFTLQSQIELRVCVCSYGAEVNVILEYEVFS